MYLSKQHINLLKQTRKTAVIRTDKFGVDDLEYLRSEGLIIACSVDKKDDFFYQAKITEKGKAVLYERIDVKRRANIAIVLSVVALIVSLLVAFTPFADWSRSWIESVSRSLFSR